VSRCLRWREYEVEDSVETRDRGGIIHTRERGSETAGDGVDEERSGRQILKNNTNI